MNRWKFSPAVGLLLAAAGLALLYSFCHLAGWREYTAILSGTFPGGGSGELALLGLVYVAAYLGATLLAPVLMLAGVLLIATKLFLHHHPTL